ncbi:hypothetical protein C8Q73DRAFT_170744 [Cubamyces lactineus]|nr:hypothetical protein C8Q73DRAFT_170744 [Cubamyces lactineus]
MDAAIRPQSRAATARLPCSLSQSERSPMFHPRRQCAEICSLPPPDFARCRTRLPPSCIFLPRTVIYVRRRHSSLSAHIIPPSLDPPQAPPPGSRRRVRKCLSSRDARACAWHPYANWGPNPNRRDMNLVLYSRGAKRHHVESQCSPFHFSPLSSSPALLEIPSRWQTPRAVPGHALGERGKARSPHVRLASLHRVSLLPVRTVLSHDFHAPHHHHRHPT